MMDLQNKIWLVVFFVILIVSSTNVLGFICRVGDVNINETYYYNNTLWNSTGNFLYPWDLNHWLGIGTPTPSHPLNVLGIGNFTGILYVNDNEQVCTAENGICAAATKNTTEQMQDAAWSIIGTQTYIDVDYLDALDTVNFNVTMTNCSSPDSCPEIYYGNGLSGENITSGIVSESYIDSAIARDTELISNCSVNGSCANLLYTTSSFSGDVTGDSTSILVVDTQGLSAGNITAGTFSSGDYVMDAALTIETIKMETNPSQNQISDNATCIIIKGSTSTWNIC